MANVIKTVLTYQLDGATRDFTIPFEYLARKFILVTLVGRDRKVLSLNSDYRFATRTTISTTKAWGGGDGYEFIELRRVTSATERLVDFTDGSILRAYDLNVAQVQTLHVAEESRDLAADTIGVNNDGHLDARGRRIVNLADAVDPRDAIPLGQIQAQSNNAWQAREQAEKFRNEAQKFRNDAEQAKNAAGGFRSEAESSKNQASKSAASAESAKSSASASASSASESAQSASSAAGTATTQASAASESAREARTYAEQAKEAAGNVGDYSAELEGYRDDAERFRNEAEKFKKTTEGFRDEAESAKDLASEAADTAENAKGSATKSASSASESAKAASSAAETATANASASSASAREAKEHADRAKEAADNLENNNELAGTIENVTGKNISWYGEHSFGGAITVRTPTDSAGDTGHTVWKAVSNGKSPLTAMQVGDKEGSTVTSLQVGQSAQFEFGADGGFTSDTVYTKKVVAEVITSPTLAALAELRISRTAVWSGSLGEGGRVTTSLPIRDRILEIVIREGQRDYGVTATLTNDAVSILSIGGLRCTMQLEGDRTIFYEHARREAGAPDGNNSKIVEIRVLGLSV